ncbi:MAG: hypothetical protein HRT88_22080 [Lentisphaeraceae bacterium]|nr:hypothetical protein [Lentisphaeraceae bacterium]
MTKFMEAHFTAMQQFDAQDISLRMKAILTFKQEFPSVKATASNIIAFFTQSIVGVKVMESHLIASAKFETLNIHIKNILVKEFKEVFPNIRATVINIIAYSLSKSI